MVTQRFARAIVARARPPPGGTTWSRRSSSSLPMSERERPGVRPDPAGPVDDRRALDDARAARSRALPTGRHDRGHRLGVGGLGGRSSRGEGARAPSQPADRDPLDGRPVDQAPARAAVPPAGRRRSPPRRAPSRSGSRPASAVVAPATAASAGPRVRRPVIARATPSSTASTSGKAAPNSRLGELAERVLVPGRELRGGVVGARAIGSRPCPGRAPRDR